MLKIRALFLLFTLVTFAITAKAQSNAVTGKIISNDNGAPIGGINITLLADGRIIYQTNSDSTGNFKIPQAMFIQMGMLKISGISYKELLIDKKAGDEIMRRNNQTLGTLIVKPGKIELKEVNVKARRRYSDTTDIDLSKKKFERSFMMDDLFSGNYGFTKDKFGNLYYKGVPVSNIQVDDGDFFGKNNLNIYRLLPALTMSGIRIVETNIDSTTNTTQLRPSVKVNLTLKPEYNKGKFGNANAGVGTTDRYLANTDVFGYRKSQQISVDVTMNNVQAGDNLLIPPSVTFAATGNSLNMRTTKFTYHNFLGRKIEIDFDAKGRLDTKDFTSLSERHDLDIQQLSTTKNSSNLKISGLDGENLNLNYRIDPYNTITFSQSASSLTNRSRDSLNYDIRADSVHTVSKVSRVTNTLSNTAVGKVLYTRRSASKKGRYMMFGATYNNNSFHINENDNVYSLNNGTAKAYFADGVRQVVNKQFIASAEYTEPLNEDSHINFFTNFKKDDISEWDNVKSDTSLNFLIPATINNNYLTAGAKFQQTFKKVGLDAMINGTFDSKTVTSLAAAADNIFKVNFDVRADYKVDPRKNFLLDYSLVTIYPDIRQVTSLNSNFDLVSQVSGSPNLKPQDKYSLQASYNFRKTENESMLLAGEFNYYKSKFGYELVTNGTYLSSLVTNTGNAKSASVTFSFNKPLIHQHNISSVTSLSYQEEPSIAKGLHVLNNGLILSQTLSTSLPVVKSLVTLTPLVSVSYSSFNFSNSRNNIITVTYSDRVLFNVLKSELTLYPLFNYSHNIGDNSSFSMNGEIRRSFLNNLMSAWVQAYDIFNSFKFYNNYVGPTYTQTTNYSNVRRYIFIGASYKFNNFR